MRQITNIAQQQPTPKLTYHYENIRKIISYHIILRCRAATSRQWTT